MLFIQSERAGTIIFWLTINRSLNFVFPSGNGIVRLPGVSLLSWKHQTARLETRVTAGNSGLFFVNI